MELDKSKRKPRASFRYVVVRKQMFGGRPVQVFKSRKRASHWIDADTTGQVFKIVKVPSA